ncbi:putative two-component system sensor kinase [Acidisarcina polymorpha]|uniref:Putative two-component system sensor kinase n=1 Tax=Acidisarcina polymorpha TaxID=2211140 RepID=A0A2Z5FVL2_9BACT|nr:putative two-component system sensor kinase [Acidisarcina polymorpha]
MLVAISGLFTVVEGRALDQNRSIAQYSRESWGSDRGFNPGAVTGISQSADGYLWVGTEKGLYRFDGLSFRAPSAASSSAGAVTALTADSQGNLWILLGNTKILRYHDGKIDAGREEAEVGITALGNRRDGTILLSSLALGTLSYRADKFEAVGAKSDAQPLSSRKEAIDDLSSRMSWATGVAPHRFAEPESAVISMVESGDGTIWLGTRDRGLFFSKAGKVSAVADSARYGKINCILLQENGDLWVGTDEGVLRWDGSKLTRDGAPSALNRLGVLSAVRDHDGNIWFGTSEGLFRCSAGGSCIADSSNDAEPGVAVTALFEDREGDLWVGTASGISCLRDSPFVTYPLIGLRGSESSGPIYVDQQDRAWFGPGDGGLYWMQSGRTHKVTQAGLDRDVVYSIAGAGGEMWVGRQQGGLTELSLPGGTVASKTYTQSNGLAQDGVYAVHVNRDGSVWAGTLNGGVSQWKDQKFTSFTTANGLASNTVTSIVEGSDGTMWFATPNGLSALSRDQWRSYGTREGLPSADLNCLFEDSAHVLWVGGAAGISWMDAGRIRNPANMPEVLNEPVLGIAEDRSGSLWMSTAGHVLRVKRTALLGGKFEQGDVREYGPGDGLRGTEGIKRERSVVADDRGRIWFSTSRGLSTIDPNRSKGELAPAIVHVETILANSNPVQQELPIRISIPHERIVFAYSGLSFGLPDRVRFRYRLDGFDRNWSEPVANREAVYTNLGPGAYRFRVMASNSEGLWNGPEATVQFNIEPAYWQTWWFRLSCLLAAVLTAVLIYLLRMRQIKHQLSLRFEERLGERMRIAHELHDTLLQGFLSASMQLNIATDYVPENSPAKPILSRVLELVGQVTEESRNTLRGLRASVRDSPNLAQALSAVPQELSLKDDVAFRVVVDGTVRLLHPAVRDELYRIGREAIVNAFRHSRATSIEVHLLYSASHLQIIVRDNGCGIEAQVLDFGREGHWGLPGMRERTEKIGGKLEVWSRAAAGTEVRVRLPGQLAYRPAIGSGWLQRLLSYRRHPGGSRGNDVAPVEASEADRKEAVVDTESSPLQK